MIDTLVGGSAAFLQYFQIFIKNVIFTREDALAGLVIEILHQQKFKVHVKMKIPLDVDIKLDSQKQFICKQTADCKQIINVIIKNNENSS